MTQAFKTANEFRHFLSDWEAKAVRAFDLLRADIADDPEWCGVEGLAFVAAGNSDLSQHDWEVIVEAANALIASPAELATFLVIVNRIVKRLGVDVEVYKN